MAVSLRFQSSGTVPGKGEPIDMIGPSLTIGRGPENDLVLPDPDRLISKNHCVIEDHGGNIIVIDFSTNGTFLNYSKGALGQTPTPLNDGDVLSMGTYELIVTISHTRKRDPMSMIAPPVDEVQVSHGRADRSPDVASLLDDPSQKGDFLDDLLGGMTKPTGPSQVKRGDDFEDMLLPPLGEEDQPLLGPARDKRMQGASEPEHAASFHDSFKPSARSSSVIPDDWDADLLNPNKPVTNPFSSPSKVVQAVLDLPPDAFDDLLAPVAAPKATPPEPMPPAVPVLPIASAVPMAETAAPTGAAPPDVLADFDLAFDEPDPFGLHSAPAETASAPDAPVALPVAPVASPVPAPVLAVAGAPVAISPPAPALAPPAAGEAAARALLAAAGAEQLSIADADLPATMRKLGAVLKIMIEGMREILMTRTSIKSEFRISQTMIGAGRNNPLKFSISPEQAVEVMIRPTARGYLDAETAASEALRDIKAHEVAMVTGMEAALKGVLARLDPKKLEEKIDSGGGFTSFLKGKKTRYWEVYEKLYAEIADEAENDFHDLFSKEFARAYQDQLERLK